MHNYLLIPITIAAVIAFAAAAVLVFLAIYYFKSRFPSTTRFYF